MALEMLKSEEWKSEVGKIEVEGIEVRVLKYVASLDHQYSFEITNVTRLRWLQSITETCVFFTETCKLLCYLGPI